MVMSINTNVNSLTAQRNAAATQSSLAVSLQRLSSGPVSYTHLTLPTKRIV